MLSDCYSGQSTRGVPGGRVSGWGSQDQELDGNTKTQGLRQVLAAMCVIPYVLCSELYLGLQDAAKRSSKSMGWPTSPLYRLGGVGVQGMIYSGCFTRKKVG